MNKKRKKNKKRQFDINTAIKLLCVLLFVLICYVNLPEVAKSSFTIYENICSKEYVLNLEGCNFQLGKDSYGLMQFSNVTCPSYINIQPYQSYYNFIFFAVKDAHMPTGVIEGGNEIEVKIVQESYYIENYSGNLNDTYSPKTNFYAVINDNYKDAIKLEEKQVCSQEEVEEIRFIKKGYEDCVNGNTWCVLTDDLPYSSISKKDLTTEWLDENCECLEKYDKKENSICMVGYQNNTCKNFEYSNCLKYSCFNKYLIEVN